MKEVWKPLVFNNNYEVSNMGAIRSWVKPGRGNSRRDFPILLNPNANSGGYLRLMIDKKQYFLHRLILLTFVGPCPEGLEACHENGNQLDNRLSNLRWDTKSENAKDSFRLGKTLPAGGSKRGELNNGSKLTEENVIAIKELYDTGNYTQKELAERFKVSRPLISRVLTGRGWSWMN